MLTPRCHRYSSYRGCIGILAALATLAWLQAAPEPVPVVLLVEDSASIYRRAATGFEEGFGKSEKVQTIYVDAEGKTLAPLLARSSTYEPRLTVAIGTKAALAAHSRLRGPILYCLALDPERNALTGENIGGFAFDIEVPRLMAEMQKALPHARRIGVIYDEPVSGRMVREARRYLNPGVKLVMRDAQSARVAGETIDALAGNIDTFWLLWDPVIANPANFRRLVEFSFRNKVALVSPATPFVEAGALMSISADYFETGRNTGLLARKILDGNLRLADLGDQPPAGPLLTVNGEVARRLGIVIPPHLRAEILSPQ